MSGGPEFEIEHLDPKELRANPLNFRRHPETQRTALAGSLAEHGWLAAPIWNKRSGHLLDGHARVELAVEKEEALIPVRVIDVPIAQEKRILRAFDRIGSMAEEDPLALDRLIEEIGDVDLERLLGEITEPASGLLPEADPDAIPEGVETRAKAGDLWILGEHRLLCGDSTQANQVKALLDGDAIDIVLTDPPYSSGGFQDGLKRGSTSIGSRSGEMIARDNLSSRGYIALIGRVLCEVDADLCYVFTDWRMWGWTFDALESSGYPVRNMLVWDKGQMGMGFPWRSQHELIAFAKRTPAKMMDGKRGNVLQASRSGNDNHPTEKPVSLIGDLLTNSTGTTCYDPFAGSGTTLIACEQTGRVARCIEIEPRYVDVCLARWEQATGKRARLVE